MQIKTDNKQTLHTACCPSRAVFTTHLVVCFLMLINTMAISAVCKPAKLCWLQTWTGCTTRTCGHIAPQKIWCTPCGDTLLQELGLMSVAPAPEHQHPCLGWIIFRCTTCSPPKVMRYWSHLQLQSNKTNLGMHMWKRHLSP